MKLPKLYKRNTNGSIQEWEIEVKGDSFFTREGLVGGAITESKPTICESKNVGQSNERSPEEQAFSEAKAKWQKQKDKGYVEDKERIDTPDTKGYKPMLAHKLEDYKDELVYPVFGQRKSDGIRCIISKDGAWTRNGKDIVTVPHIQNALLPFFDRHPKSVLDGELYNHEFHDDFNKIASLVKKTKPSIEDIFEAQDKVQYHIYDAIRIGTLTDKDKFSERSKLIKQELKNVDYIHIVETYTIKSEADIQKMHDKFVEEGYEGLMVRQDGAYQQKRSKLLLKFKHFQTEEFIVTDIESGRGNKANLAATVHFRTHKGKPFSAGIIGDEDFCKKLLYCREEYIGKPATVKYFNYTPDEIPRFPKVTEFDRQDNI